MLVQVVVVAGVVAELGGEVAQLCCLRLAGNVGQLPGWEHQLLALVLDFGAEVGAGFLGGVEPVREVVDLPPA